MKDMFTVFDRPRDPLSIEAFRVALASPPDQDSSERTYTSTGP